MKSVFILTFKKYSAALAPKLPLAALVLNCRFGPGDKRVLCVDDFELSLTGTHIHS